MLYTVIFEIAKFSEKHVKTLNLRYEMIQNLRLSMFKQHLVFCEVEYSYWGCESL